MTGASNVAGFSDCPLLSVARLRKEACGVDVLNGNGAFPELKGVLGGVTIGFISENVGFGVE